MTKKIETSPPAATTAYCPAVPISLYREVVGELQATKAQLDSLKCQNQQLVRQNQQLRQEAEKIFYSAQNLKQVLVAGDRAGQESRGFKPVVAMPPSAQVQTTVAAPLPQYLANLKTPFPHRWGLALLIGAIGFSAFAAGFFLIPLLMNQNNR
ncbi:MAG: hypothetical protein ACFB4I_01555 [Cyanophyceae cyanobacterium]